MGHLTKVCEMGRQRLTNDFGVVLTSREELDHEYRKIE